MTDSMIRELFRGLERTIHERLEVIEDVLRFRAVVPVTPVGPTGPTGPTGATANSPSGTTRPMGVTGAKCDCAARLRDLEEDIVKVDCTARLRELEEDILKLQAQLRARTVDMPLVHPHPLEGIEVVPRKEVVLTETSPEPLSVADRLLLNSSALKALEQDEEEAEGEDEVVAETSQVAEEEEEEQVLEEDEEVEAAEAEGEEEEELEEFEYKNSTYYRDPEKNVYMADEDGELIPTPIGVWSEVKKRIIIKKQEA